MKLPNGAQLDLTVDSIERLELLASVTPPGEWSATPVNSLGGKR